MNTRHEHDFTLAPDIFTRDPSAQTPHLRSGGAPPPPRSSLLFAFRCGQAVAAGPTFPSYASSAAVSPRDWPEPWPRHLDTKPRHQLDTNSTPRHPMPTRPTRHPSTPLDTPRHHLGWYHARPCQGAKLDTSTPLDTARHRSTPLDTARHRSTPPRHL